jgi:hypothetical protein
MRKAVRADGGGRVLEPARKQGADPSDRADAKESVTCASLRSSRLRCCSALARCFSHSSSFTSSVLKGHCDGIPGSLGAFGLRPDFFSSLRFLRWCSLTFLRTLYFCLSVVRLLLLLVDFFGMLKDISVVLDKLIERSLAYYTKQACKPGRQGGWGQLTGARRQGHEGPMRETEIAADCWIGVGMHSLL